MNHDCMDYRVRDVHSEGDDVYTERCLQCGKSRMEHDGVRVMAWHSTPYASWPWKYAYDDPHNTLDGTEVWKDLSPPSASEGERPCTLT